MNARKCQKKSNHSVLFEGAQHLAASSMSNHEHVMRHDLKLRTSPNTLLQVHADACFVISLQPADCDLFRMRVHTAINVGHFS